MSRCNSLTSYRCSLPTVCLLGLLLKPGDFLTHQFQTLLGLLHSALALLYLVG
jgi:hypothetical protein